jgi:hypothetical protein
METECSLPCSQKPSTGHWVDGFNIRMVVYKYIEYDVVNSRQGVVFQFRSGANNLSS